MIIFFKGGELTTLNKIQPCVISQAEITRRQMCDGIFDCPDLSDECLCDKRRQENKDTYDLCKDLLRTKTDKFEPEQNTTSCDYGIACAGWIDEKLCLRTQKICDGIKDCSDGLDENHCKALNETSKSNQDSYLTVTYNNSIQIVTKTNLDIKDCNGLVEHPNGTDEMNCDRYYYCTNDPDAFRHLYQLHVNGKLTLRERNKVLIGWRQRYDGVADCPDKRDEWRTELFQCTNNETCDHDNQRYVESPEYSIRSRFFVVCEWIIGIVTVAGNIAVIKMTFTYIRRGQRISTSTKMINKVMVLSLCLSDLLVGIVVMGVAISDAVMSYRHEYWKYDENWRSGVICELLGSGAIFATQVSAMTIFLITAVRLITVYHPFHLPKRGQVLKGVVAVWTIALILTIPPLIPASYFNKSFIYAAALPPLPQVDATIVGRKYAAALMKKIDFLYKATQSHTGTSNFQDFDNMGWYELEEYISGVNPKFGGWKYFGTYALTSICLPSNLLTGNNYGWLHSLIILALDFAIYIFVLVAYIFVCKKTTSFAIETKIMTTLNLNVKRKSSDAHRDKEDAYLQRRTFFLIITNLASWMPMCIGGFVQYASPMIKINNAPSLLFSFAMVEINSMINPFLYSISFRGAFATAVKTPFRKCASCMYSGSLPENRKNSRVADSTISTRIIASEDGIHELGSIQANNLKTRVIEVEIT